MAYITQENKKVIKAALDLIIPKTWKFSLSIDNHSTICLNIKSAPIDLPAVVSASRNRDETVNNLKVNQFYIANEFKNTPELKTMFEALPKNEQLIATPLKDKLKQTLK